MIHVVLNRPIYARNIGMCARAMANMNAGDLILITPRGELSEEAKQGAAHAQNRLQGARVFESIDDFFRSEGNGIRIALSGRDGRLRQATSLDTLLERISIEENHSFTKSDADIYLMFGPEDDGLSNHEMELCHHVCRLPTFGEITSLNLSHAVLLALYLVQSARTKFEVTKAPTENKKGAKPGPAYYPSRSIEQWLETLGFDLSSRRVSIEKTLNRIILARCPSEEDLRIFDTVLQQTVRKLKDGRRDEVENSISNLRRPIKVTTDDFPL